MHAFSKYKKYIINVLTTSLVAASLVAVFSVLIGSFNDTSQRILWTLLVVVTHSLLSVIVISLDKKNQSRLELTRNVIFFLIPVSVVCATLGIWSIISSSLVAALYQAITVIILLSFHINFLQLLRKASEFIDRLITSNIVVTTATAALIMPLLFIGNPKDTLGDFYYRLLAAVGIINGTLTVLVLIFFKLFIQKHPKSRKQIRLFANKNKISVWVWILIVFLAIQVVPYLIFGFLELFKI